MFSCAFKVYLLLICITIIEASFFNSDCRVTQWSTWKSSNSGYQTRIRRIMRNPGIGGKPCPHLNETRGGLCQVTVWSAWSANFGFGQQSRTRAFVSSVVGKQCTQQLEEIRYTGQAPSVKETAKNVQNFFLRPNGQFLKSATNKGSSAALPRDLVLIMDSSGSIGRARFPAVKSQTSRLIGLLCPINPFDKIVGSPYQYNQAAMLTFSTTVVENFNFNTYVKTVHIQRAILSANYVGRSTYTHLAFEKARGLFHPSKGVRDAARAEREVLILTDGRSSIKTKTLQAVEILKKEADVYGLMIGNFTTNGMQELTQYVSPPTHQHLFYLQSFSELKDLVDEIETLKIIYGKDWCAPFN